MTDKQAKRIDVMISNGQRLKAIGKPYAATIQLQISNEYVAQILRTSTQILNGKPDASIR